MDAEEACSVSISADAGRDAMRRRQRETAGKHGFVEGIRELLSVEIENKSPCGIKQVPVEVGNPRNRWGEKKPFGPLLSERPEGPCQGDLSANPRSIRLLGFAALVAVGSQLQTPVDENAYIRCIHLVFLLT